jgi:FAD/FMN-containing dehydrogenase/Fe-S oxidoreductase
MTRTISLPTAPVWDSESIAADVQPLAEALQRYDVGQVRLGDHDRILYATDASLYQVRPLGVVIPSRAEQVRTLVNFCRENQVALLPRGGGTSLAGQCTNQALVVDFSPGFRAIRRVDVAGALAEVEPGLSIESLNRALAAGGSKLFFAPDPATIAQAAIGGCIGNNAAGARSIRYGRTSENLAGVEVLLTSGEWIWLEPGAGRHHAAALRLAEQTAGVVRQHAAEIRQRFPKLVRRNAGYALDLVLDQLERGVAPADLDLSGLICGSEGTLAVITAARLKLRPLPAARGLAILAFGSLDEAIAALPVILATRPSAVELLDDVVLAAAAGNNECRRYLELMPLWKGRAAAALLYVEYEADKQAAELPEHFRRLTAALPAQPARTYLDADSMGQAWTLRKAGEALLHAVPGQRKPLTFVEDNAIPVPQLLDFVREFKRIVAAHGTTAAFYAHASVGVLHVRPLLDLHATQDRQAMHAIALEIARLARACGGVMSGEHGDGRARGPLLEEFFGPQLMSAFRQIKRIFDPAGILNPGFIVRPGDVAQITTHLRVQQIHPAVGLDTYFDYAAQGRFQGAVEMCNGAGFCRKTAGGTMCPSYRSTLEERHSPRGRANALRASVFQRPDGPDWLDPATLETLDLCLSCKACKTECPSNVDIARWKAEYLAQGYRESGHTPAAAQIFGHIRLVNQLGALAPNLANRVQRLPLVRTLLNSLAGLAAARPLPDFGPSLYRRVGRCGPGRAGTGGGRARVSERPTVALFGDCFTAFGESDIGLAAVRVFEALGYTVALPRFGCCGRAMLSNGLLESATATARRTLQRMAGALLDPQVRAIVVIEPSCWSAMIDDWPHLKNIGPHAWLDAVRRKVMLADDFAARFWTAHPVQPDVTRRNGLSGRPVIFHGHCHQKALAGPRAGADLLQKLLGRDLQTLEAGCCGMAGAFGYTQKHYDLSMNIFAAPEFDPLRQAPPEAVITASGTSCRQQIAHATGRPVLHPLQLAAQIFGVL